MKAIVTTFLFASSLVLAISSAAAAGCRADDTVDSTTGKTISDLDIGGDLAINKTQTQQMSATIKYADGTSAVVTTNGDLVWNIGNTGVATISQAGVVTGVSIGETTIKATYQGKESSSQALVVK